MRLRFKSVLIFIFMLFIACAAIGIGYIFYDKVIDKSDIVVDGDLTINYMNGDVFNLKGNSTINFSITNNGTDTKYYYIQISDVLANNVNYELMSSDDVKISNVLKSDIILNQVAIDANETVNYELKFIVESSEEYSGKIVIGLKSQEENLFADIILNNNEISRSSLSKMGENATLDEGLLEEKDDLGISYYFRGNVLNNNVLFADMYWKIVKINGDGSVKLVLDGIIDEVSNYYDDDISFSKSNVYDTLNTWYDTYLNNYGDYIAYYKFCNDNVIDSDGITYNAYNRVVINKIPTFVCLGDSDNSKIGLLTADEVTMAGASTTENKSYYLYNEDIDTSYWTMTGSRNINDVFYPFMVDRNGALINNTAGNLYRGVRPVINIIKTAKVEGDGTYDNPYKLIIEDN